MNYLVFDLLIQRNLLSTGASDVLIKKDFFALPWSILDSTDDTADAVNVFKKLFYELSHTPLEKVLFVPLSLSIGLTATY